MWISALYSPADWAHSCTPFPALIADYSFTGKMRGERQETSILKVESWKQMPGRETNDRQDGLRSCRQSGLAFFPLGWWYVLTISFWVYLPAILILHGAIAPFSMDLSVVKGPVVFMPFLGWHTPIQKAAGPFRVLSFRLNKNFVVFFLILLCKCGLEIIKLKG